MAEIPQGSSSYRKRNPHLFIPSNVASAPLTAMMPSDTILPQGQIIQAKPAKRIRQSSKPLMNKLETEFYERLCCEFPPSKIKCQAVTLRLANGVRYSPDFFIFHDKIMHCFECKGAHAWEDSLVKLKVAASAWPDIKFNLAWKDKKLGWRSQPILP